MGDSSSQSALGRGRPSETMEETDVDGNPEESAQRNPATLRQSSHLSIRQHRPSTSTNHSRPSSPPVASYIHNSDSDDDSSSSSDSSSKSKSNTSESLDRGEELVRRRNEYTLKDRQDAYNIEHPFGLPIWKPALYKKDRSVTRNAETAVHVDPNSARYVSTLLPGNLIWAIFCGIPLCVLCFLPVPFLLLVPWGGPKYARVIFELATYLLWPFGRYVERTYGSDDDSTLQTLSRTQSEQTADEQTAITTSSQPTQYGTAEQSESPPQTKSKRKRSFWKLRIRALGRLTYWAAFYFFIAPVLVIFCLLCWACVFTVPMAKLLWILLCNLGSEPLALHFRSPPPDLTKAAYRFYPLKPGQPAPNAHDDYAPGRITGPHSTILVCTYRAFGLQYYKYTIDGVNIIFINLVPLIMFAILDFFLLSPYVQHHHQLASSLFFRFITSHSFIFVISLLSVIPLSYFIGMAVASISAQSSIGMGAVINATFGSIIEVILYSIALTESRASLVEGSIVGSLLAGVLLMPGLSMVAGAWRKKEQRFNARSAGVTSTMLIMAIVGALTPTLFYQIYGTFQLTCEGCPPGLVVGPDTKWQCRRCSYDHRDPIDEPFYQNTVKKFVYYCAVILILSYLIGLWFSLRTHASQIWQNPPTENPKPPLGGPGNALETSWQHTGSSLKRSATISHPIQYLFNPSNQSGNPAREHGDTQRSVYADGLDNAHKKLDLPYIPLESTPTTPTRLYPTSAHKASEGTPSAIPDNIMTGVSKLSPDEVDRAFRVVAATATALGRPGYSQTQISTGRTHMYDLERGTDYPGLKWEYRNDRSGAGAVGSAEGRSPVRPTNFRRLSTNPEEPQSGGHGGHDAPNWSRLKSASVLLICTAAFAAIAEILVDVVDVVLEGSKIPEKLLGVTLFALVPNTAEFMNAISFALNGNIALSMEIGSQYCLQVCLLQIPAMVAFTWIYSRGKDMMIGRGFSLVLPKFDVFAIIIAVFLLTYVYLESRSNYYRGSILVLSYLVLLGGFVFAPSGQDTADDPMLVQMIRNAFN